MGADKIIPCCRWIIIFLLLSCAEKYPPVEVNSMFTLLPSVYTGIDFENTLVDELGFNVFKYRNYYNGGGVAIGDINSDYLPDIYLVANNESNRLYINKGNMQFKDVTKDAGVAGLHKWSTGVCMVDINGDGLWTPAEEFEDINGDAVSMGIKHIFSNDSLLITQEESQKILEKYFKNLQSENLRAFPHICYMCFQWMQ